MLNTATSAGNAYVFCTVPMVNFLVRAERPACDMAEGGQSTAMGLHTNLGQSLDGDK